MNITIYPAIRAKMGTWTYYIVRMKMRAIAQEIKLAHEIYEDATLSEVLQRDLAHSRRKHIVGYLARREDRFFSSIVVAAIRGKPSWQSVQLDEETVSPVFATAELQENFGLLSFGDDPSYYALDGQHRVLAIRSLVNGKLQAPEHFDDDYLSVIVIVREDHEELDDERWMRKYRRLFTSLNRYAKPTDTDTNIIMDEDDLFAIVTRGLITNHEFFKAEGRERESIKVQTRSKNLKKGSNHFTSLQTLYAVNECLLTTDTRRGGGWPSGERKLDRQFRPDEDFIEGCSRELHDYWDAILKALPDLQKVPEDMRRHDKNELDGEYQDHLLFWPIGQELIAQIIRELLDNRFPETGYGSVADMAEALAPLRMISWELHDAPWRYLLLVPGPRPEADGREENWRIRSEDRKLALIISSRLLRWMLGIGEPLNEDAVGALRESWRDLLYPDPESDDKINEMWEQVIATRDRIIGP